MFNAVRFHQIPSNAGIGLELKVIAAAVVGGVAIAGGRGTIAGTLLGLLLLGVIGPALTFLGIQRVLGAGDRGRDHSGGGVDGRGARPFGETCRHR